MPSVRTSRVPINRRRRDITASVTWSSSTPSVATIDATGLVTAVGTGTTTITAAAAGAFGAVQGTSNVQVNLSATPPSGLSSISIVPSPAADYGARSDCKVRCHRQLHRCNSSHAGSDESSHLVIECTRSSNCRKRSVWRHCDSCWAGDCNDTRQANLPAARQSSVQRRSPFQVQPPQDSLHLNRSGLADRADQWRDISVHRHRHIQRDYTGNPGHHQLTQLKWVSSDVGVATINSSGFAIEAGLGTTAITAEWLQTGSPVVTGTATSIPKLAEMSRFRSCRSTRSATALPQVRRSRLTLAHAAAAELWHGHHLHRLLPSRNHGDPNRHRSGAVDFGGWSSNCTPGASALHHHPEWQ